MTAIGEPPATGGPATVAGGGHRAPLIALIAVTALIGVQLAVQYPALPERVASHFDAAGNPDGYSSKATFVAVAAAVGLGDLALFGGIGWLLGRLPPGAINVPRRDYWLAPERRAATVAALTRDLLWFGFVTQLFVAAVFQLVLQANRGEAAGMSGVSAASFWVVLGGYLGYVVVWLVLLVRRHLRVPAA